MGIIRRDFLTQVGQAGGNTAAFIYCRQFGLVEYAFAIPAPTRACASDERRNLHYNIGFSDGDFSVIKNSRLTVNVTLAEMSTSLNRINLAPVKAAQTWTNGTLGSTIGAFFGIPGIGSGEPFSYPVRQQNHFLNRYPFATRTSACEQNVRPPEKRTKYSLRRNEDGLQQA